VAVGDGSAAKRNGDADAQASARQRDKRNKIMKREGWTAGGRSTSGV